jgi:hypothetical protein
MGATKHENIRCPGTWCNMKIKGLVVCGDCGEVGYRLGDKVIALPAQPVTNNQMNTWRLQARIAEDKYGRS